MLIGASKIKPSLKTNHLIKKYIDVKNNALIGKIVTIRYFEVTQNETTKGYGLRFPTWTGVIRDDKDEISMH